MKNSAKTQRVWHLEMPLEGYRPHTFLESFFQERILPRKQQASASASFYKASTLTEPKMSQIQCGRRYLELWRSYHRAIHFRKLFSRAIVAQKTVCVEAFRITQLQIWQYSKKTFKDSTYLAFWWNSLAATATYDIVLEISFYKQHFTRQTVYLYLEPLKFINSLQS